MVNNDVYAQFEVFLIYLMAGLGILLQNVVYLCVLKSNRLSKIQILILDFVITILPMILVQTIFSDRISTLLTLILSLIFVIVIADIISSKIFNTGDLFIYQSIDTESAIHISVMWVRACVFLATSIAILGVDLSIFPRRFAKTSRFGHSLMDTGTAAFVFLNALSDFNVILQHKRRNPILSIFKFRIPSFFILLVMGVGRSLFVLFSDYQHNVAEYGVHWNFFITLFFLRIFVSTFFYPYSMYVGLILGVLYEIALHNFGLADFILRPDEPFARSGFIDENREGIFSLLGYIFLYALTLLYMRISTSALRCHTNLSLKAIFSHGISLVIIFVGLQKTLEYYGGMSVSRRLANMPYTFAMAGLFAVAVSGFQVFIYFIGQLPPQSRFVRYGITSAISRNGLVHFLLSNLVTGLVNIFLLRAVALNKVGEFVCIVTYTIFTCLIVTLLNWRRLVVD